MIDRIIAVAVISLLLFGCATPRAKNVNADGLLSLKGVVLKADRDEVEIEFAYAETPETSDSVATELAQKVISKTIFVAGGSTYINGIRVTIDKVAKNSLTVKAAQTDIFAKGNRVSINVPKKQIALIDFEVISNSRRDMGRILQESLISELVESEQFIVLERAKLKTVLDEIKLSKSGLTRESSEAMAGKIMNADFILTGTLAEIGGEWNVNLRILNVRTSQVVASIAHNSPLFKFSDLRDTSPLGEGFEEELLTTWNLGYQKSGEDFFKVSVDHSAGAVGSTSSLRVDFDFSHGSTMFFASANTMAKRDLTQFRGIEFYVKGSAKMTGHLSLLSSHINDPNKINNWVSPFEINREWKKIRIPFDSLVIGRDWIKAGAEAFGARPGDQLLRLNRIEAVRVGVKGKYVSLSKGTFWIDRICFYR